MELLAAQAADTRGVNGVGSRPRVPVGFGMYEIGRSGHRSRSGKNPEGRYLLRGKPSPWTADGMAKTCTTLSIDGNPWTASATRYGCRQATSDPGQYDPYANSDMEGMLRRQPNDDLRKPFNSTEYREVHRNIYGEDAPPPGFYGVADSQDWKYRALDSQRSVFRSQSLQRPCSKSEVPAGAHYSPNMGAVLCNSHGAMGISGHMQSQTDRFGLNGRQGTAGQKSQTPREVSECVSARVCERVSVRVCESASHINPTDGPVCEFVVSLGCVAQREGMGARRCVSAV